MHSLSYATLEQIVGASVQGILLLETCGQTARIRYANRAYERLSGYCARELAGNAWGAHFAGDSVGAGHDALERLIARGDTGRFPLACLRKDGSVWCSDVHLSRIGGTGGEASLLLAQHVVSGTGADDGRATTMAGGDDATIAPAAPPADRSPLRAAALAAGMLSTDQFMALLSRDLAIARRHGRDVTLFLFQIIEYDVYRQTFGQLAADACARMVATQILGTFGRSIDLRARLDATSFVVAVHEQPAEHSERLARLVADKTARLSLPNPKGRASRHVELATVFVQADSENDDADALIERARATIGPARTDSKDVRQAAGC